MGLDGWWVSGLFGFESLPWNPHPLSDYYFAARFCELRAVAAFLRVGAGRGRCTRGRVRRTGRLRALQGLDECSRRVVLSHWRDIKLDCGKAPTHATRRGRTNAPQKCSRCKNIPRVRKCPDITRLNSLFAFCIFLFLSFCRFVWRKGSSLKSHSFIFVSKF